MHHRFNANVFPFSHWLKQLTRSFLDTFAPSLPPPLQCAPLTFFYSNFRSVYLNLPLSLSYFFLPPISCSINVYLYTYIFMYIYIHIYKYTRIRYTHIYTHIRIRKRVHVLECRIGCCAVFSFLFFLFSFSSPPFTRQPPFHVLTDE